MMSGARYLFDGEGYTYGAHDVRYINGGGSPRDKPRTIRLNYAKPALSTFCKTIQS
jgi:hypothetical protein